MSERGEEMRLMKRSPGGNSEDPFNLASDRWPGTCKLVEEMGELGQQLGRLIGLAEGWDHWDGTNVRDELAIEIADVYAALAYFTELNGIEVDTARVREKLALYAEWRERDRA